MTSLSLDAFKEDFRIYHSSLRVHDRLLRIVVDTKYLEASTETIFQYILQLMVVLVVSNSTRVQVGSFFVPGTYAD